MWIPLGLTFFYIKKLKSEKASQVAAGILPVSKIEDDKRKARKRLIVIWICMVPFTLTTFLWMPYVSGISLGLRGDVFVSIATLAMVSVIFRIQLKKLPASSNVLNEGSGEVTAKQKSKVWIGVVFLVIAGGCVLLWRELGAVQSRLPQGTSVVMHRKIAGTRDSSGWYHADSTEGQFAVDFPLQFNDFTIRSKQPDGRGLTTVFCMSAQSTDGIKMSAVEIPADSRAEYGPQLLNDIRKKGLVVEAKTRTFDYLGAKAVEWLEENSEKASYQRVVDFDKFTIIMGVEYPTAEAAMVEPQLPRFFESLTIKNAIQSPNLPPTPGTPAAGQESHEP